MQTLKIEDNTALKLYPTASPEFKAMLEETFGKPFFNQKITDRVKTFDDACKVLGIVQPSYTIEDAKGVEKDFESIEAYTKLIIIARALNEEWKPDWNNHNQYKYYPFFKGTGSGSALSFDGYADWYAHTAVGSRLCFKSAELAEYAGKQFLDIYNQFLTIQ